MTIKFKVTPIQVGENEQRAAIIVALHQSIGTPLFWNVKDPFTASANDSCGIVTDVSYEVDVYGIHPTLTVVPNAVHGPSLESADRELLTVYTQFAPHPTNKLIVGSVLFTTYLRGEYERIGPTNAGGYMTDPRNPGFYPTLCARYRELLQNSPDIAGVDHNTQHLIWMLDELQSNNGMSLTKKHRWLGFIQGVMVAHGLMTVDTERKLTRDVFKGA